MRTRLRSVCVWSAAALSSAPAIAQQAPGPGYGPHMWNGGWGWGWMFAGPLMMIVFLALAVAVVVLVVRWLAGGSAEHASPRPSARREPIDILRERFAKGEIDKEEYEERRRVLEE